MEVELKFLIEDKLAQERILKDSYLIEIKEKGSEEEINMRAVYFDTEDMALLKEKIAFRVRMENDVPMAALKWGGQAEGGLHERGELNVPVDVAYFAAPDLEIFKGSDMYGLITEITRGKKLRPVMEVNCLRRQLAVDTGKSLNVISLDIGEIVTAAGKAPVNEVEIELYSGDKDDMVSLGKELAAKYNLKPEDKSKFQRGLELLGLM